MVRIRAVSRVLTQENKFKSYSKRHEEKRPFTMQFKLFPCALLTCLIFGLSISAYAQVDSNARQLKQINELGATTLADDDPVIISVAETAKAAEDIKPINSLIATAGMRLGRFLPLISGAIDERLGSRYRWGATGPRTFDCSGFVWATFHAAGIDFERGSARNLYSRFEAPLPGEQYKFGTLVFFNHLSHVGIVADENGFYHASRHHGVVYASFAGYWGKHITGFRRVPLPALTTRTGE